MLVVLSTGVVARSFSGAHSTVVSLAQGGGQRGDRHNERDRALARSRALQAAPYDEMPCKAWCGMPDTPTPMKCGVLWFLHVPKTGGSTMASYFKQRARNHKLHGWKFVDMWQDSSTIEDARPGGPIYWGGWNKTAKWRSVLSELEADTPKLLVHAHHNMPGLGSRYFATEVLAPLALKLANKGCELRFATVLRDAVEYNDFDIILDHFPRVFQLHPTPHALWVVFYLVPSLTSC